MFRKLLTFSVLNFIIITSSFSQTIIRPNFGLKSHETLELNKIVTEKDQTLLYMTIENRIRGGNFCAGENIYIIYPDGKRSKIKSVSGIPVCPETYNFKTIGEKLAFTLAFPPLRTGTKWIDLVEDCDANCFSVYGITLDSALNKKIDNAYLKANSSTPPEGIKLFSLLLDETGKENPGASGMIYINIIKLAGEAGDKDLQKEWYNKLESSNVPGLPKYIKLLNDNGIKY